MNNTNRRRTRAGFTLIEILVVLAIIGLLMSLSMAAYQRVRVQQAVRSTEDVVLKLQTAVDTQAKIVADDVMQERRKGSDDFNALLSFCDGDADRTQAFLTYCRLRQAFPTPAELSSKLAPPLAMVPGFTILWNGGANRVDFRLPIPFQVIQGIGDPSPEKVSAAILMVALSQRTQGGNTFASDEATTGAQMDYAIATGQVRVYRDGWSNPIAFQRFLMSAELNAAPYVKNTSSFKDPFDPLGKLASGAWANRNSGENQLGYTSNTLFNNQNKSITVFSFGVNKAPDSPYGAVDDILGYRLRMVGGRGANP